VPSLDAAADTGVFKAPLGCNTGCVQASTVNSATPLTLASDGNNTLFVADGVLGNLLLRYDVATDETVILASRGNNSGPGNPERSFKFITGLGTALDDNLVLHIYVADDPSDGAQVLQGAVWDVQNQ
jgi:hypothetical protein